MAWHTMPEWINDDFGTDEEIAAAEADARFATENTTRPTTREEASAEWTEHTILQMEAAEDYCSGAGFIRRDRIAEFRTMYGAVDTFTIWQRIFHGGNNQHACYWATEELLDWWERNPRTLWIEYAVSAGVATTREARAASRAAINQSAAINAARRTLSRKG